MLEPYEGKLSCTVLRGERGQKPSDLPDATYYFARLQTWVTYLSAIPLSKKAQKTIKNKPNVPKNRGYKMDDGKFVKPRRYLYFC